MNPAEQLNRQADEYFVNIIFQGLFLAWLGEDKVSIRMPDVSRPGLSELSPPPSSGNPPVVLREHLGALEFLECDWRNPQEGPRPLRIKRPNEDSVGIHLLNGTQLSLTSSQGTLISPSVPASLKGLCNPNTPGQLHVLEKDLDHGFRQLATYKGTFNSEVIERDLAAWIDLDRGFIQSQRRSLDSDGVAEWVERGANAVRNAFASGLDLQQLVNGHPVRPLNLDLRVVLVANREDPVVVELRQGGLTRRVMLRPMEPDTDLTFWIKNQEPTILLRGLSDPSSSCDSVPIDIDQEALKVLDPGRTLIGTELTIPIFARRGDSHSGCACGGCSGGP